MGDNSIVLFAILAIIVGMVLFTDLVDFFKKKKEKRSKEDDGTGTGPRWVP